MKESFWLLINQCRFVVTQLPEATVHSICIKPIKPDRAYELWRKQSSKEGQGDEEKRRNKNASLDKSNLFNIIKLSSYFVFIIAKTP
jgi:hypothetical protein